MKRKLKLILDGMIVPFVIYVGVTFITSFAYALVYTYQHSVSGNVDPIDPTKINAFFVQGVASVFILGIFIPLYMAFKKVYGVKTEKFSIRKALYVIPLAFSICVIGNIVMMYMPIPDDNEVTKQVFEAIEKYGAGISIFMVAFLIPLVEEYIFRGFMFGSASLLLGDIFAIVLTSLLFGLVHFNLSQGVYAVFAGVFLGYVRYKYGSVSYTMLMHLVMNASSIIFMPAITLLTQVRDKIFIVLICVVLIIMSIYKINEHKCCERDCVGGF